MNKQQRTNAGYTIIASIKLPIDEYVVGEMQLSNGKMQYVTWYCVNGKDYYFGHYINDKNVAMMDLYERAEQEIKHYKRELLHKLKGEEK